MMPATGAKTDAERILEKLERIHELPTLPAIVIELNRKLQDHDTPVEDLIETIETDQAIVLKILKMVNSAFYGCRSQVSNLRQAVVLLGFGTIRNAVLSVSIINAFKEEKALEGLNMQEFWRHSVAVAVSAKKLAETTGMASPDDSFVAGLLHDVGKVVLFHFFRDLFEQIWHHMKSSRSTFFVAESETTPVDHTMIGGSLTRKWRLPDELVNTILHHHQPDPDSDSYHMQSLIYLANTIVHYFDGDASYSLDGLADEFGETARKTIEPALSKVYDWYPQLSEDIGEACDLILGSGHTCRGEAQELC
jgi:putative nucleotidyltransferase with HDIG domain